MDLDTSLARWVFVWMGGLWVVLSLCVLLSGRTTMAMISLAVASAYAVALLVLERTKAAASTTAPAAGQTSHGTAAQNLRNADYTGPSTRSR
jgi:hypothetical protein